MCLNALSALSCFLRGIPFWSISRYSFLMPIVYIYLIQKQQRVTRESLSGSLCSSDPQAHVKTRVAFTSSSFLSSTVFSDSRELRWGAGAGQRQRRESEDREDEDPLRMEVCTVPRTLHRPRMLHHAYGWTTQKGHLNGFLLFSRASVKLCDVNINMCFSCVV